MNTRIFLGLSGAMTVLALLVGCASLAQDEDAAPERQPATAATATITGSTEASTTRNQSHLEIPRPENELAEGEYQWRQLLSRDAIAPIYEPEFVSAAEAPYADDELVIGVEINGEAKAYAIGPLNSREMVNDTLGGRSILVTW